MRPNELLAAGCCDEEPDFYDLEPWQMEKAQSDGGSLVVITEEEEEALGAN